MSRRAVERAAGPKRGDLRFAREWHLHLREACADKKLNAGYETAVVAGATQEKFE